MEMRTKTRNDLLWHCQASDNKTFHWRKEEEENKENRWSKKEKVEEREERGETGWLGEGGEVLQQNLSVVALLMTATDRHQPDTQFNWNCNQITKGTWSLSALEIYKSTPTLGHYFCINSIGMTYDLLLTGTPQRKEKHEEIIVKQQQGEPLLSL